MMGVVTEHETALELRLQAIEARQYELIGMVRELKAMLAVAPVAGPAEPEIKVESERADGDVVKAMGRMTPKQHGALQMIVRGASDREIAQRFGVEVNTAKVYVRTVRKKLDAKTRTQVAVKAAPVLKAMSESRYEAMSGGLPKDWDRRWDFKRPQDDPWWPLYSGSRVQGGEDEDEA